MVTSRSLLSIAVQNQWNIKQLGINNAFLHGDLNEEVYMTILQGYPKSLPPNTSYADTSLFTINHNDSLTALLVYVDDILLVSKDNAFIQAIKTQLHEKLNIQDFGPLHYYLGIEFLRNDIGLAMTQTKYALELLECADLLNVKRAATPMDLIVKLNEAGGYLLHDPSTYMTLVGKLLYLTITKPDLSFVAQALSQYSHSPRSSHFEALIRVLRYVKLCHVQGLFFPQQNFNHLTTYCDSDWASCATTKRSVSVYAVFLSHNLISWQSKKQIVVSRSSTKAEYKALANITCEISWLRCLLLDLGVTVPTSNLVMCDNASTIALANNPIHHARTKHIEIDCNFVRDKIREGQILPCFVPLKSQIANILTRGLCRFLHFNCLSKLGICDPYTMPTCGRGEGRGKVDTHKHPDPNTPSATTNATLQSIQRTRSPPKMKVLHNSCLIHCSYM
ncbi:uncharacterized mitochondrial protein-like protein [Tanacetum coccineum]